MARIEQAAIDQQLDQLAAIIAESPNGIGREALRAAFASQGNESLSKRTLLRRLSKLVEQGQVEIHGQGGNRVYRHRGAVARQRLPAPVREPESSRIAGVPPEGEPDYPPLSPEGAEVRALIRRPIMQREYVGYDPDFLESYVPGITWYLPEHTRARLHELGRTPDPDRPAGTFARDILERLLVDLAWASSRLEGNTYSRLDTQNLIEFGQRVEGKDATDAQMILNHKNAIELLVEEAGMLGFNRPTLLALHGALSENLLGDPAEEGRLRARVVQITGTTYVPTGIPQVIEERFAAMLEKGTAIQDPFEQAFFAMVHIPYLQPFADVNKRTSRLAANIPLVTANLCPLSFVDVPERAYVEATLGVYELTRVELLRDLFVWAYERSCKQYTVVRDAMGQPDPVRLRYRDQLTAVVRETVLDGAPPRSENLRAWGGEHGVPAGDLDAFADRALALLLSLGEGTARRYGLRFSQVEAWRATMGA